MQNLNKIKIESQIGPLQVVIKTVHDYHGEFQPSRVLQYLHDFAGYSILVPLYLNSISRFHVFVQTTIGIRLYDEISVYQDDIG